MELKDVLLARRSVRKFTDEAVSKEDVNYLLHAAMSGPSACNKKPWDFFVVTNADVLQKLRHGSHFSKMSRFDGSETFAAKFYTLHLD